MTDTPTTMTVIAITAPGGPEVLKPESRPVPVAKPGEVVIAVHAAGVNRPDVFQRAGRYDPPPGSSDLPGLEVAGRVHALGDGVTGLTVGDAVCALAPGGGYAEFCAMPAGHCLPVPAGLSMTEAAALPETLFTVWSNVFDRAHLRSGETLLVHGGSSGIGTTAIQLGKAFGARVFTTAGSADKCAACERLGAERAVNYREEDFVSVLKAAVPRGIDVVLDMVGGDYVARNLAVMAPGGRHVTIAALSGGKAEINVNVVMTKRLTLTGSTLRPRSVADKSAIADALRAKVWRLIEQGEIRPVMDATFPLADAAAAHALMESSGHIGKIVLVVRPD